ncbi:MAG: DUF1015 domain-containing protein [Gemmatimonadetes bacterium]|nr:DUF1015 domain-containing protein [Gemmatimonadota bacterium]
MPDLTPFCALRYSRSAGDLSFLLAPPYDVIDPTHAHELRTRSDHNCVRLILPEGSIEERYVAAAETLNSWTVDGVLGVDPEPSVYLYRQRFEADGGPSERLAVFAALRLTSFEQGDVLPHERTHTGPKKDRLALTLATRTQLSPVFMVARDGDGRLHNLERELSATPPDVEAATPDGIRHSMWIASGETGDALLSAAGSHPLLIADGHHRYETALVAAETLGDNVKAAYLLVCVVSQQDPGLVVRPTHRILSQSPGGPDSSLDWLERLAASFDLEDLGFLTPEEAERRVAAASPGSFVVAPAGAQRKWLAAARPEALMGFGVASERARMAPVVFDELVLGALFELDADEASHDGLLSYSRSPDVCRDLQTGGCGFILPPVSLEDVWATAALGGRLPPKSTYFEPKMPSGLLFRPL